MIQLSQQERDRFAAWLEQEAKSYDDLARVGESVSGVAMESMTIEGRVGIQEIWAVPYCLGEPKPHMVVEYLDPPDPIPARPADWDGWRPADTMPAWAVRLFAVVRAVSVERGEDGVWRWKLEAERAAGNEA